MTLPQIGPQPLPKEPNKVRVSLSSPEDGNRPIFRNVVFSNYLESKVIMLQSRIWIVLHMSPGPDASCPGCGVQWFSSVPHENSEKASINPSPLPS
jgi:hypothetical protein